MNKLSLKQKVLAILAILGIGGAAMLGGNGLNSNSCTASSTKMTIGNQEAITVLHDVSNRAWARLQQPKGAVNVVSLSLGGTAVSGEDLELKQSTSTSPNHSLDLGLDTDLPYVGIVSAITDVSSTTLLVTECIFN